MCLGEIFPDGKIMNQDTRKVWKELPCIFSTSSIVRFITSSCVMAIVHSCGEHQSSPVSARWVFFFFGLFFGLFVLQLYISRFLGPKKFATKRIFVPKHH